MSCCGQKRAALRSRSATARAQQSLYSTPSPAAEAPRSGEPGVAFLRYLGRGSLSVRGPATGSVYFFSEAGSAVVVHEKDMEALMRTCLFAR